jgi:ferritin
MQLIFHIIFIVSLISIIQSYSISLNSVGKCLSELATQEFSNSYNYLQLSSKSGTINAYPGFSSLFIKLSDDDLSKAHDLAKFLALRKIKLDRLINPKGIRIHDKITRTSDISSSLIEARNQNKETLKKVQQCHQEAANVNDANVQDYLESDVLQHHIELDKLIADFEERINEAETSEKELIIFMIDEELLNTYGDPRKDIFS